MVKPPPPLEPLAAPEPEVLGKISRVGADVAISSGLDGGVAVDMSPD